jgi:hypothetical protein
MNRKITALTAVPVIIYYEQNGRQKFFITKHPESVVPCDQTDHMAVLQQRTFLPNNEMFSIENKKMLLLSDSSPFQTIRSH